MRYRRAEVSPPGGWFIWVLYFIMGFGFALMGYLATIYTYGYFKSTWPVQVEEYELVNKFTSSDECFAYYDPLSADYEPLSVDLEKFTETTLNDCYLDEGVKYYPVRLSLKNKGLEFTSSNWDDELGAYRKFEPMLVELHEGDDEKTDYLIIELQKT